MTIAEPPSTFPFTREVGHDLGITLGEGMRGRGWVQGGGPGFWDELNIGGVRVIRGGRVIRRKKIMLIGIEEGFLDVVNVEDTEEATKIKCETKGIAEEEAPDIHKAGGMSGDEGTIEDPGEKEDGGGEGHEGEVGATVHHGRCMPITVGSQGHGKDGEAP